MSCTSRDGKVAIVTGSNSGIGEAIAIKFAQQGFRVTLCGRDLERLQLASQKVTTACGGHENRVITVGGDINNSDVRRTIVESTIKAFGQLDVLVLNAGVTEPIAEFLKITEEVYDNIMNTNVRSQFFMAQQAVPYLEKTKGAIVAVSSFASTVRVYQAYLYPMSKSALDDLCESLAYNLGAKGIRVNTVNPSFVKATRILRTLGDAEDQVGSMLSQKYLAGQPLSTERIQSPEDVANAVSFLVSEDAAFITGQHVKVDGGLAMAGPVKIL